MPERRVAMFHRGLGGGGIERALVVLAEGLSSRGCAVDLILLRGTGPNMVRVPPAAHVLILETDRTLSTIGPLARYLTRAQPDALLSLTPQTNLVSIAAGGMVAGRTRVVVGDQNHISSRRVGASLKDRIAYRLCRVAYPRADRVVASSSGVADDVAASYRLSRERVEVIHNPVAGPPNPGGLVPPDHPWFESGAPPVFVNMGRLAPQKDQATLLRAFARLRADRPARLIILGEGPLRRDLEALVRELGLESDVLLPGYVNDPFSYLSGSAAFVLSSRFEGFGNVVAEALMCGAQVVSTDCPSGPSEILAGGRYGALVPVGDHEAMSEAMGAVLDCPRPVADLRYRAEAFSVDRIAAEYERLLFH